MVFSLGVSQDSTDGSELGGLVMDHPMERSPSSASSCESNPEPPAPLRQGQQRPGRPPFRTQLSEPNWIAPHSSSPSSMLQRSSIASPDSELSADSQSASVIYAPEHFRHEPFSVFYGTNNGGSSIGASGGTAFCCVQLASLEPVREEIGAFEDEAERQQQQEAKLVPGPFLFSPGASAWLTRVFQQKAKPSDELIAGMLQMHTARFDKNRRSSLAPNQPDFGASAQTGQGQLSPYGPESLFFCIGQAGSRKNSFAGPSPTVSAGGQQCFFTAGPPGAGGQEVGGPQGQKQQKRKRAVITMDAHSTQILIASDSVCRLFGFRDRSLIGKKLGQVFPLAKSPLDLPEGTRGPLLLQNVFFTDPIQQKQLKPVYGKPVDILDADGQRQTLSVWSYPLAGATTTRTAPRKNSAVLLRSPSAFLPSFQQQLQPPQSPGPAGMASGPSAFAQQPNVPGGGRASQTAADCSPTKVCPAFYAHNNHTSSNNSNAACNSQQQQLRSNLLNSLGGQNSSTTLVDLLPSAQRAALLKSSSSSSSSSSSGSSSNSSSTATAGFAPQLKEVLEEEQQQNCDQQSRKISPPSLNAAANSTATPSSPEGRGAARTAFEEQLNELSAVPSSSATAATEQQQRRSSSGAGGAALSPRQQQQPSLLHEPSTSSNPTSAEEAGPKAAMVQAGVPVRGGATNGPGGLIHHKHDEGSEGAIVIIPLSRAEMVDVVHVQGAESQQKGFLRRQHNCEILPNTSTGTAAEHRKSENGGQQHSPHQHQNGAQHQQQQQQNDRWLVLMEPLPALFASVILGAKGRIFRVDDAFTGVASILGYESTNRLLGTEIQRLIPSLNIGQEWEAKEQLCCGSTVKHNGIPLTATVKAARDQESGAIFSYEVQVRSIASISGVFMLTEAGTVYSYNENLFHELLGMDFGQDAPMDARERAKLDITDLVPHFFEYLEVAHFHIRHHRQDQPQQLNGKELVHENGGGHCRQPSASVEPAGPSPFTPTVSHSSSCLFTQELTSARRAFGRRSNSFYGGAGAVGPLREDQAEDEELGTHQNQQQQNMAQQSNNSSRRPDIIPGIFYGLARHIDGMMIPVKIEVSNLDNNNSGHQQQQRLFAVCIGFDRTLDWGISQLSDEEEQEEKQASHAQQQLNETSPSASNGALCGLKKKAQAAHLCHAFSGSSSHLMVDSAGRPRFSIGSGRDCDSDSAVDFVAAAAGHKIVSDDFLMRSAETKLQEVSLGPLEMEDENNEAVRGEYSKHYDTFQLLGNGAFGSVKLAARKDTGLLTVTKFITKTKVLPESWVASPKRGNRLVPIEVHLLENLNHQNIVQVLDVFENDKYYQLVMEKCGCGMDLFEFIDHQPKLDESLISYIFRQIVSAVDYLHANNIVHRDLKDENVIIDQNFCCKLIDFGSAAFFGEGIVFSTFCGTMEYCSPEVLTGNKYLGPELEMWSMGILLYTLVFFENPFRSVQETVHADIELPWDISEGLYQVLNWLLQPDPRLRATVGEIKRHWWLTQQIDPRRYSFKELLRNCERAQVVPPLYVSDLHNHLKNASVSCSNLASVSISSALQAEAAATASAKNGGGAAKEGQPQQMGIVSAR